MRILNDHVTLGQKAFPDRLVEGCVRDSVVNGPFQAIWLFTIQAMPNQRCLQVMQVLTHSRNSISSYDATKGFAQRQSPST